ncbi:MAG TPA: response regulator transcription factor [Terriglobales bacterium]|nr:response regulator transcription factor [Terriglobales bacterium]
MPLSCKPHAGPITVLVADADVMACRLLAGGLRRYRQLRVLECHLPPADLLKHISEMRPDILLVGNTLPDGPLGGFGLVREIRRSSPEIGVVVLLESSQRALVVEAFRAGAKGVFCRADFEFRRLCKCVSSVIQGQIWANSQQLQFVMDTLSKAAPLQVVNSEGVGLLTKREEDVVRHVVDGLSNREIAEQLRLSEHTVKNYLFRIFEKLGISNRVELVTYVITNIERLATERGTIEKAAVENHSPTRSNDPRFLNSAAGHAEFRGTRAGVVRP